MPKKVYFHENERVDAPDANALGSLANDAIVEAVRSVGAHRWTASDYARTAGSVLKTAGVVFSADPNQCVIAVGLKLRLCGANTADPELFGELVQLTAPTIVPDSCPTEAHQTLYLLARPGAEEEADPTDRVFYATDLAAKERIVPNTTTRKKRPVEWAAHYDQEAIDVLVATGYSYVAKFVYNDGSPEVATWYTPFPRVTNATRYPGGELTSDQQAIQALASEVAATKGVAWDEDAGDTVASLRARTVDASTGNTALGAKVNDATIGNTALGAKVNSAGIGNIVLGQRIGTIEISLRVRAVVHLQWNGASNPDVLYFENCASVTRTSEGVFKWTFEDELQGLMMFICSAVRGSAVDPWILGGYITFAPEHEDDFSAFVEIKTGTPTADPGAGSESKWVVFSLGAV